MIFLTLELELTRLTCSDSFNSFVHQGKIGDKLQTTPHEAKILQGSANVKESRLLQRSPMGKEILIAHHDHRILAISQCQFPP